MEIGPSYHQPTFAERELVPGRHRILTALGLMFGGVMDDARMCTVKQN